MASTTVYAAKANLKALLEANTWPNGTPTIAWGQPTEEQDIQLELIYMGGVDPASDEFRMLGKERSDESYLLRVMVEVREYGDDEQSAEQRAWVLHDEIITLLRDNMTLDGAIHRITGWSSRQGAVPQPELWRCQIVIDVACEGFVFFT